MQNFKFLPLVFFTKICYSDSQKKSIFIYRDSNVFGIAGLEERYRCF